MKSFGQILKVKSSPKIEEIEEEEIWPFKKECCETLEEAVKEHPYLASYLEEVEIKPKYVANLGTRMGERDPSIIYPLGLGIYVHIVVGDEVSKYNIVEPEKPDRELLDKLEAAVARLVSDGDYGQKRREVILTSLFKKVIKKKWVKISKDVDENVLLYFFLREKVGHGFIDGFLADSLLEDISIPGEGNVYVYHKMYGPLESNIVISRTDVDRLLRNISERYGKVLSFTHPIIDIHLPDGSRLNVVFGEDISLKGSNFTIRKFPEDPISVAQLIGWGTFTAEMAAYLWMLFDVGVSAFVNGETASGKTTSLTALT
ncbi:MAG TPA: hypothetical protein ENN36_07610, partial [Candidatus Bathyarchaeota archaeon]|nr:hypothetical protein [Candidatus Bathyarchaeota archaeon]